MIIVSLVIIFEFTNEKKILLISPTNILEVMFLHSCILFVFNKTCRDG